MRTIRRMLYAEVLGAVGFVTLAFLGLFMFFDLVDALGDMRRGAGRGYNLGYALLTVGLQVPTHLYELLPITVLIGAIFVMARLAASSEFTILRTSGLGPGRALSLLLGLGLGFVALTFVIGDYVAPAANRVTQSLQARLLGDLTTGRTGAWLKDRQAERNYSVNVAALGADGQLNRVRIFEFDNATGELLSTTQAASGQVQDQGWQLAQVDRRVYGSASAAADHIRIEQQAQWLWPTALSHDMVASALLSPERMQAIDLYQYIRHLKSNGQNAQRYELEFWRKVFYPLSCLVMMVLALPFAYLHFRSGNITGFVFIGVLVGISFFLLNNLFGHIGNLRNWVPWVAAAAPGVIYSLASLTAFGWLVLRQ